MGSHSPKIDSAASSLTPTFIKKASSHCFQMSLTQINMYPLSLKQKHHRDQTKKQQQKKQTAEVETQLAERNSKTAKKHSSEEHKV